MGILMTLIRLKKRNITVIGSENECNEHVQPVQLIHIGYNSSHILNSVRITRNWIESARKISGRLPKRYESLQEAFERMHEANSHLRIDQARHLTIH